MFVQPYASWVPPILCKFSSLATLNNFTHRFLQGIPVTTVELTGYLVLGPQPIVLPLYVSIH